MKKIIAMVAAAAVGLTFMSCGGAKHSAFRKVTDYLFEVNYDNYEGGFKKAQTFCTRYMPKMGGCSSVQNGYFRGRNYDWTFDEEPEFVVHVPAAKGRHASIGVAATTELTAAQVESGKEFDFYNILPYITLDGINDAGLTANINVVNFGEKGAFRMKTETTDDDICPLMVCRIILDQAGSIDEALALMEKMDIYSLGTQDECHFMISGPKSAEDPTFDTVVVELIPDADQHYQLSVIDDAKGEFVDNKIIMTNFHLTGFDGSTASLTAHPMGYERYLILYEAYDQATSVKGMEQLMKKVYYTNAYDPYSDMFWYSEFANGDLTLKDAGAVQLNGDVSKAGKYAEIAAKNFAEYQNGTRTSEVKTWHTVHTSIYDCEHKTLSVLPQEAGFAYSFSLN